MILSGNEIVNNLENKIIIEPFNISQLNPNSYNLTLHNELVVYKNDIIDVRTKNDTETIYIPDDGYMLIPGQLYLARTCEHTETHGYVPAIQGRSSVGRLGITVHISAGFGDVGFCGYWTMQLTCVKKTIIYPKMKICQIYYHEINGDIDNYASKKYQDSTVIQASKLYSEITSAVLGSENECV